MLVGYNPMKPQPNKIFTQEPDSVVYTQDAFGRTSNVVETYGVNTKTISTTFYDDGSVKTVETVMNGRKRVETYTYTITGSIQTMVATEVNV